jgi:transposase
MKQCVAKSLTRSVLFATEGRDHQTVIDFAADLKAHGGSPEAVQHVSQDMSAANAKGAGFALMLEVNYPDRRVASR